MPKTRETKEKLISELSDGLDRAKSAVFVDYKGLKVKETEELRRDLRAKSVDFKIVKNSLFRIVLKEKNIEVQDGILDRPLGVAMGFQDEVVPAKALSDFAKSHETLEIMGGLLDKEYINEGKISQLAALPSREELYAKLVGTIAAPLSGFVNVAAGNLKGIINVMRAKADKSS